MSVLTLAAVASAVCGACLHPHAFLLMSAVPAVLALGLVWPWLTLRGLNATLEFDRPHCQEGDPVRLRLRVRNWCPGPAWGLSVRLGGDEVGAGAGGLAMARALRVTEAAWDYTPTARGLLPAGTASLTCGFPFGLWQARTQVGVAAPLTVRPWTFPAGPLPEAAGERAFEGPVPRPARDCRRCAGAAALARWGRATAHPLGPDRPPRPPPRSRAPGALPARDPGRDRR